MMKHAVPKAIIALHQLAGFERHSARHAGYGHPNGIRIIEHPKGIHHTTELELLQPFANLLRKAGAYHHDTVSVTYLRLPLGKRYLRTEFHLFSLYIGMIFMFFSANRQKYLCKNTYITHKSTIFAVNFRIIRKDFKSGKRIFDIINAIVNDIGYIRYIIPY
jgi:hypothetical protein